MKALRRYIDRIKPHFEKGGRFEMLHSTFEAFETFLFVPDKVTVKGTHIRDSMDMKRLMIMVVIAMVPALLFGIWNAGYQHFLALGEIYGETVKFWAVFWFGFLKVFPIIVVSYVVGLGLEFTFAQIRGHEVNEGFLVTGILIPLVMPADVPLWMVAVATVFAVIIGKEVFGGTGMNILNPALTARAFLFFAYPGWMSGDKVWVAGLTDGAGIEQAYTGATILGQAAAGVETFSNGLGRTYGAFEMFVGSIPGSIGETSTLAILLGAVILIFTGVGSWKIIVSVFAGGAAMAGLLNLVGSDTNQLFNVPFWQHLMLGGFAFGAVFMATDPVSGAQTEKGKWIYGFLIGVLSILIRILNPAYPEGVMLAILFMNVFAPLIDHYIIEANIRRRLKRFRVQSQ